MSEPRRSRIDPSVIAALIGVLGTICVTLITLLLNRSNLPITLTSQPTFTTSTVSISPTFKPTLIPTRTPFPSIPKTPNPLDLEDQIRDLQQDVDLLIKRANELDNTNQRLDAVDKRLSDIEKVILDNPSKAIDNVVLRKDIESLRNEIVLLRDEISASKGSNYSVYSIAATISIALISISIVVLNTLRPKNREEQAKYPPKDSFE